MQEEKERRIEHARERAIRRIGQRDLAKGWTAWLDMYEEHVYMKRKLLAAGSKMLRPALVRCFSVWRHLATVASVRRAISCV